MGKLIFIQGGARSGKSAYLQQLAKSAERERGGGVVFIATAEALTGRLTSATLLGVGVLTIFLVLLARGILKLGLRNYSGASA